MRDDIEDMPYFYSWETPDFELTITPPGSLVDYDDIVVSFHQGSQFVSLHKDEIDVSGDVIYVKLTQEQSGKFSGDKPCDVEVNVLYADADRNASTWGEVWVRPNLYRRVMT